MGAWHYCLLHMVVVVPNSPWWRPDTAVCYTRGCGCPWLTLMKAWHCLLHTWLLDTWVTLLFVTHVVVVVPNSPLTLLFVTHMVVVVPDSDTAVCVVVPNSPWLEATLLFVTHMVVVVPDSPWWGPDTAHTWLLLTHLDGGLTLLFVAHMWLWLSLTHLDGGLTLLFVTHMVVVVPNSPWWRPDTAVCYTHGCGCPWLTLIEEAWHCCLLHMWLWLSLTHLDRGLTLLLVAHMWLWLSLTHLDRGLTLLFVAHMVVVVPDSPWWEDTVCCTWLWLSLAHLDTLLFVHTWLWLSLTHLDEGLTLLFVTHVVVVVPDSPWWRSDTAVWSCP